jgi:DNA-binding CsgD family transcriptional regulator/tetratricopeptide (TPR) repeat protein
MGTDIPLVARHRELSAVIEVLESAASGRGQGVLVTGEAGIGKTRLLREARLAAEHRGLPVLTGRAVQSGGAYRPLVEAFARPAAAFTAHPDLAGVRPALARVLPGWVAETTVLAPMADPTAVLATALILLLQTMAPNGAVLIIDDLQWADPDTISVLTALADSIDDIPLALITATRGETPTDTALHELRARHSITELPLRRLTPAEVSHAVKASQVLQSRAEQLERLVTVIDGLPLIMDEFIRQIRERDSKREPLNLTSPTLASAVQLRLAGLSPDCRLVLDALSVIGDTDADVLIAATGLDSQRLGPALHAGLASTLLVPATNAIGVEWRHALIGEVVRDLLLPMEEQLIARRAADRLAAGSARSDGELRQAAHLYELVGDRRQAGEHLLRAARLAVAHGALDIAQEYLSDAQRITGDLPESAIEVLIERIETLNHVGRAGEAYDSGMAALSGVSGPNLRRLLAATIRATYNTGHFQESFDLLARLERESETDDAALMALRTMAAFDARRPEGYELGRKAALQAEREGRLDLACDSLMGAGWGAWLVDLDQAAKAFSQALALSRQHGLTLWEVFGNYGLGSIDMITDSDPTRLKHSRSLAATAGMVGLVAAIDMNVAVIELVRNGFVAAYPKFLHADTQARRLRLRDQYAETYGRLLDCHLLADQPLPGATGPVQASDIEAAVAQAVDLAKDYRTFLGVRSAQGAQAWLHGDSATAIRRIEEDTRQYQDEIKISPWWGFGRLLRVADGDNPAEAFDRRELTGHHTNWAARAFGIAVGQLRYGEPADAALGEAEHHLRNTPFWGHLLRTVIAPVVAKAGMRSEAERWLREADAFLGVAGERPIQRKVRRELADIGGKVPRTGGSVPAHLARLGITNREADVLRLVNAGLSNADIAEHLYISVRTVETHVSSMLQKTGAEGRDRLPRW